MERKEEKWRQITGVGVSYGEIGCEWASTCKAAILDPSRLLAVRKKYKAVITTGAKESAYLIGS